MTRSSTPLLDLLKNYKHENNKPIRGADIGKVLQHKYDSLLDLLPTSSDPAIFDSDSFISFNKEIKTSDNKGKEKIPLFHSKLKEFVSTDFDLTTFGLLPPKSVNDQICRVSVMLPNGPELAVLIIALISKGYCVAPINPTATEDEIYSEVCSTQSRVIFVLTGASISANNIAINAASRANIGVATVTPTGFISGLFKVALLHPIPSISTKIIGNNNTSSYEQHYDRTVLLLHTSGTSGNKKLVPYSLHMLVVGVGCIIQSWRLGTSDVCLNMMPLFHIGGIVRNVLSPILAGGSVIACSGFDPLLFWDILVMQPDLVTWYDTISKYVQ